MYIDITVTSFDKVTGSYNLRVETDLPDSKVVRKILSDTLAKMEETPVTKESVEVYGEDTEE